MNHTRDNQKHPNFAVLGEATPYIGKCKKRASIRFMRTLTHVFVLSWVKADELGGSDKKTWYMWAYKISNRIIVYGVSVLLVRITGTISVKISHPIRSISKKI